MRCMEDLEALKSKKSFLKENKRMYGWKPLKTNQSRWEWHHNIYTPSLHLVPFCCHLHKYALCLLVLCREGLWKAVGQQHSWTHQVWNSAVQLPSRQTGTKLTFFLPNLAPLFWKHWLHPLAQWCPWGALMVKALLPVTLLCIFLLVHISSSRYLTCGLRKSRLWLCKIFYEMSTKVNWLKLSTSTVLLVHFIFKPIPKLSNTGTHTSLYK